MRDSLPYFALAGHFLRLAEAASRRLVETRNTLTVVSGSEITADEYAKKTRWSDHSIGVAVLFNFYHGLELLLKACLLAEGVSMQGHKLLPLLAELEKRHANTELATILRKHIREIDSSSPLCKFLADNGITIDDWYQSLKYPTSTKGKKFTHWQLQYGSRGTVKFWRGVKKAASNVRKAALPFVPPPDASQETPDN